VLSHRYNGSDYYRLSAYFIPFRIPGTDVFQNGASLDDIVRLYEFDSGLRLLTMQAIDRIEVGTPAVVTYETAHALGTFGYADAANFNPAFDHARFLKQLEHEERRSSEIYIAAYRKKYRNEHHLPVWMATELISFGSLSQVNANLSKKLQKKIAREFGQPGPVFLSWLHALTAIRNICAHHGRLWNRELSIKPALPDEWNAQGVSNRRFYVIALIIQSLPAEIALSRKGNIGYKRTLVDPAQMLFPSDWQLLDAWVERERSAFQ
jgi:abortive infection bacteriophage resistance protein